MKKETKKSEIMTYQNTIRQILTEMGKKDIDPRHIEGYMRLMYSTLDHLPHSMFVTETVIGINCIKLDGVENAEQNAKSFGL
mgnify:CR=1 FL=1